MGRIFYEKSFFTGRIPLPGMVNLHLLFIWLLLIFQFTLANAYSGNSDFYKDIRFNRLSINDGLSQNLISAIHQDQYGSIWVGTKDGLNKYNGYSFRIFKHDPFDPYSLSDNFIKTIFCDSRGRLWVGTHSGGLNLYVQQNSSNLQMHKESLTNWMPAL